jgi:hypothetical protein
MKNRFTPDWAFGIACGIFMGWACGMIVDDPNYITLASKVRINIVIGLLAVATVIMIIRNRHFDSSTRK